MTYTDTELAVIAAVASTSTLHPVLFGQRLILTIKYTRGGQPAADPRTITVRVRTTVCMPLFADIWALAGPAVAGFAAVVAGWVRKIATKVNRGLNRAVPKSPATGPVLDTAPVAECGAVGVSRDRSDRAGRWIGADQPKGSVNTGWTSARPPMVVGAKNDRRGA